MCATLRSIVSPTLIYTTSHLIPGAHAWKIHDDAIYNLHIEYGWKISAKFYRMVSMTRDYLTEVNCIPMCKARIRNARLRINRSYRVRGRSSSVFNTSASLVLI